VKVFSYREVLCKSVEVQGVSEISPFIFFTCKTNRWITIPWEHR
jgi:hypothetical protein